MTSEVPPIPESENSDFNHPESTKSRDINAPELQAESTSDDDTGVDNELDELVKMASEPEDKPLKQEPESQSSTNTILNLAELDSQEELTTPAENSSEQETEILPQTSRESSAESELFVDSWLDEPEANTSAASVTEQISATNVADEEINDLAAQKATLQNEIETLKIQKEEFLFQQTKEVQNYMMQIIEEGTQELRERKTRLQIEIEKLERRRDRINQEMRANFAGSSQELAVKVQGFKEYLVGSLQDLARAAEKLDLGKNEVAARSSSPGRNRAESINRGGYREDLERDRRGTRRENTSRTSGRDYRSSRGSRERDPIQAASQDQFSEPTFADQSKRIRQLIDKYRNNPDYYGSPWQLRRTFEPIHAKKVQDWFFVQGGRGAIDSMGSRLQNILVASAAVSILHNLYGDRCRVLVLTDTPENLGEWRRGLQDCLGISRSNFGSNRGVTLFDSPEIVVQRAERLIEEKLLPMIIIDETDELLNLSVLKFPLWLAFASSNRQGSTNYLY